MKRSWVYLGFALLLVFGHGCFKTDKCVSNTIDAEEPSILSYISAKGISAIKHTTGLYYQVQAQGSGPAPALTSRVFVKYTGRFLNDQIFDSTSDASKTGWVLGQLIEGWQIGLPLINKGGRITLIIPSALAYGCGKNGNIPGNSILVFDIELVDVQ